MSENKEIIDTSDYDAGMKLHNDGDYDGAFKRFMHGAEAGDADCQYYVGICYEKGLGVGKDVFEAQAWYRKASAQGHAEARAALMKFLNF